MLHAAVQRQHDALCHALLLDRVAGHRFAGVGLVDNRAFGQPSRLRVDGTDLVMAARPRIEMLDDVQRHTIGRDRIELE